MVAGGDISHMLLSPLSISPPLPLSLFHLYPYQSVFALKLHFGFSHFSQYIFFFFLLPHVKHLPCVAEPCFSLKSIDSIASSRASWHLSKIVKLNGIHASKHSEN